MNSSEQDQPTRKPRNPTYDVYRLVDDPSFNDEAWVRIAANVQAANRKHAIRQAVAGESTEDQAGTFATTRHGDMKVTTRQLTIQPVDTWI